VSLDLLIHESLLLLLKLLFLVFVKCKHLNLFPFYILIYNLSKEITLINKTDRT
jgi:hypothetical protein